jgi:5'-3' exonuclease
MMKWDSHEYIPDRAIDDYIFMCFTVGNDFLPHIPGIEIAMGSIERMIQIYKQVSLSVGHLTKRKSGVLRFRPRAVKLFMNAISVCEEDVFSEKLNKPAEYFPDPMMEKCSFSGKIDVDLYRRTYSTCHFVEESGSSLSLNSAVKDACHSYLEGMQWVLSYYTSGVPDWKWSYHYNYAPFAHDISAHIDSFEFKEYGQSKAVLPFVQLLCVLPPSSAKLIPAPLNTLLENRESSLAKYYPEKFRIDICGKRQEWEGVAILPFVDYDIVENEYKKIEHLVDKNEEKRNRVGKTFSYKKCNETYELKSYYGNYPCSVKTEFIEL